MQYGFPKWKYFWILADCGARASGIQDRVTGAISEALYYSS